MNTYIKTGIYYIDIREFNSDVAHLYEHLLIRTFEESLSEKGFADYLYGWVHGQTFRDVMFIEYGIYNPEIENIFIEFINKKARIDYRLINYEISCIESEMQSNINIASNKELVSQLKLLDGKTLICLQDNNMVPYQIKVSEPQVTPRLFIEKKSKKSFKQISMVTGFKDATLDELVMFLRILPIINDLLLSKLFVFGLYQNERSQPLYRKEYEVVGTLGIFTIKRGAYSNKEIEKLAKQAINGINIIEREKELDFYKKGFLTTPNWSTFPIEYYESTGIIASKKEVAKLLTPSNIQNIFDKLEVKVKNTISSDWEACS